MNPTAIIFCPRCQTLLLEEPDCPACSWQRPAAPDEPGGLLWEKEISGRWQYMQPFLVTTPELVITYTDIDERAVTHHSRLLAFNRLTGEPVWQYDLPARRRCQPPVVAGSYLIITSEDVGMLPTPGPENKVVALSLATGQVAWTYAVSQAHTLSTPTATDDLVFVTDNQQTAYGLALTTGKLHWRVGDLPFWNRWQPAAVGAHRFFLHADSPYIISLNQADGRLQTIYQPQAGEVAPLTPARRRMTYAQGRLFAIWQEELYGVEATTGKQLWQKPSPRGVTTAPVATADTVYIAVKEQPGKGYSLYALAAATGQQRWVYQSDRHFRAAPLVTSEAVYVGNDARRLAALAPETGQLIWETAVNGRIRHTPQQQGNQLYVMTHTGRLATYVSHRLPPPPTKTAARYRQEGEWEKAGTKAALNGRYDEAAQDYQKAGQPYQAAQLYEKAGIWNQAASHYLLADQPQQALRLYQQEKDERGMAQALLALGQYEKAANQFETLQMYPEAATAFEKAGLMNQAAICHAQAGNDKRAIDIYQALKLPEPAAALYRRLGQLPQAVKLLEDAGLVAEAAQMLLEEHQPDRAAQLWEQQGQLAKAAQIWRQQGNQQAAAELFVRHHKWADAAAIWEEMGEWQQAAHCYEKAGELRLAAQIHAKLHQYHEATVLFKQIQAIDQIAFMYEADGEWHKAAQSYLEIEPPQRLEAARCYEKLYEWPKAAELYEEEKQWEKAAYCWQKANQPDRAAHLLLKLDQKVAAAELFLQANKPQQALTLLAESQEWYRVRQLANQLNEHQREAEACLLLAAAATGNEAWEFYLAAARAFERAAEQSEQSGDAIEQTAGLWQQAADCHEKGFGKREDRERCLRQVRRLYKLPEIVVKIQVVGELIELEYHQLTVEIENIGYGIARYVSVRVQSEDFDGDIRHTQKLKEAVRPGQSQSMMLRVRPHENVSGSAVPLDMELAYLLPDDTEFTRKIRGQVAVRRRDSQAITGQNQVPGPWSPQQMAGATVYQVYTESAEFFAERAQKVMGDVVQDGGQKGDRVEMQRSNRENSIRLTTGASRSENTLSQNCRACNHLLASGEAFCGNCGHPVGEFETCRACNHVLRSSQKFCLNCGQPVGDTNG